MGLFGLHLAHQRQTSPPRDDPLRHSLRFSVGTCPTGSSMSIESIEIGMALHRYIAARCFEFTPHVKLRVRQRGEHDEALLISVDRPVLEADIVALCQLLGDDAAHLVLTDDGQFCTSCHFVWIRGDFIRDHTLVMMDRYLSARH